MHSEIDSVLLQLLRLRAKNSLDTSPALLNQLENSVAFGQYKLINDRHERCIGYVVWGEFSRESVVCFRKWGVVPHRPEEWCEGKFLVVLDLVVRRSSYISPNMIIKLLPTRKYVSFVRRGELYVLQPRSGFRPIFRTRLILGADPLSAAEQRYPHSRMGKE